VILYIIQILKFLKFFLKVKRIQRTNIHEFSIFVDLKTPDLDPEEYQKPF